jgi:tRNA1Val (adenine37-N6)-methyltransferase
METFSGKHQGCFDYIVSNPPFFVDSLKPRKQNLVIAKHAGKKFLGSFFDSIANLLCPQGAAAFIFPSQMMGQIVIKMIESEFFPVRITSIVSKPNAEVSRVMIEIAREISEKTSKDQLIIRGTDGRYTAEYKSMTGDFYLFLNE